MTAINFKNQLLIITFIFYPVLSFSQHTLNVLKEDYGYESVKEQTICKNVKSFEVGKGVIFFSCDEGRSGKRIQSFDGFGNLLWEGGIGDDINTIHASKNSNLLIARISEGIVEDDFTHYVDIYKQRGETIHSRVQVPDFLHTKISKNEEYLALWGTELSVFKLSSLRQIEIPLPQNLIRRNHYIEFLNNDEVLVMYSSKNLTGANFKEVNSQLKKLSDKYNQEMKQLRQQKNSSDMSDKIFKEKQKQLQEQYSSKRFALKKKAVRSQRTESIQTRLMVYNLRTKQIKTDVYLAKVGNEYLSTDDTSGEGVISISKSGKLVAAKLELHKPDEQRYARGKELAAIINLKGQPVTIHDKYKYYKNVTFIDPHHVAILAYDDPDQQWLIIYDTNKQKVKFRKNLGDYFGSLGTVLAKNDRLFFQTWPRSNSIDGSLPPSFNLLLNNGNDLNNTNSKPSNIASVNEIVITLNAGKNVVLVNQEQQMLHFLNQN